MCWCGAAIVVTTNFGVGATRRDALNTAAARRPDVQELRVNGENGVRFVTGDKRASGKARACEAGRMATRDIAMSRLRRAVRVGFCSGDMAVYRGINRAPRSTPSPLAAQSITHV